MPDFKFETALVDRGYVMKDWARGALPDQAGLANAGIYFSLYMTGASGRRYHGQREFDGTAIGKSLTISLCQLRDGDRSQWPEELWSEPRSDDLHSFAYKENASTILFSTDFTEVELNEGGWTWRDAGGHWDLTAEPLGDRGYYFWIPPQEDIPVCHYHRGQCYYATGTINGDPVRGYGYLERAWGPKGTEYQFWELPLIRRMNKLWMHWYASFEDGGYITGCARKGRLGVNWSMAYVVNDGVAEVITPTMTDIAYTPEGLVERARLNTGKQVLEFSQDCALYYPFHTAGRVTSVTGRGRVVDSWTDLEWWPDNADEVLAYATRNSTPEKGILAQLAELPIVGETMVLPSSR